MNVKREFSYPLLQAHVRVLQVELLTSLKSLHKHVEVSQLPTEFDGTFPFSHNSWICFRTVRSNRFVYSLPYEYKIVTQDNLCMLPSYSVMTVSPVCFFQRLEQLTSHCEDAINLLQSTIRSLESTVLPPTAEVLYCTVPAQCSFVSNAFFAVVD